MKERKGILKWSLPPAILALLVLLLPMLSKDRSETEQTLPAPTTEVTVASQPTEETEQVEETEPETTVSEEATEETEVEETEAEKETKATEATKAASDKDEEKEDFGDEAPYWVGPDPGTPENPYLEVRDGYPAEVESVKIPIGQKVSYVISGSAGSVITIQDPDVTVTWDGKTYQADADSGEVSVDLSKLATDPVITLEHSARTATAYVISLAEGIGGVGNPELLTDPAELLIQLPEGDSNGYHYQWISQITGRVELALKAKEIPETQAETTETTGEEEQEPAEIPTLEILVTVNGSTMKLSEAEDGKLIFDTVKGQDVRIQVIAQPFKNGTYPAIEETAVWTLLSNPGTKENPMVVDSIEALTVSLEAGNADGYFYQWTAPTYANVTLTADNLNLTATVADTEYDSEQGSLTFHVDKDQIVILQATAVPSYGDDEAIAYRAVPRATISGILEPDLGTPENPAVQESIEEIAFDLKEGDRDGYAVIWTAENSGELELKAEETQSSFDVILTNKATEETAKLSDDSEGILTMKVKAGQSLLIQTIAKQDENGMFPAADVTLKGTFTADPGSIPENPIIIEQTETESAVAMAAGQTLYFSADVREMILRLENAHGATIHYGESTVWSNQAGVAELYFPAEESTEAVTFWITSRSEKEIRMSFRYPEGHEKNPAELKLGENKITFEQNDEDGYVLEWTADCDGELTVAVEGKVAWQFRLDDLTAEVTGQQILGGEETDEGYTVEVTEGSVMKLTVWTRATEEDKPLPAGNLTVKASFIDPLLGTEEKPIVLEVGNILNTVKIPAGEKLYYTAQAEGMILHASGKGVTVQHNGSAYTLESGDLELTCHGTDSMFILEGDAEKDHTCTLRFTYPKGHQENPAELVMGENTAEVEDGSLCGYAFSWTAESSGLLTITMTDEDCWQYIVSNETAGISGVIHTCEDQPAEASETIEVTKGDRVLVIVNTFDQEHPLNGPAGNVVFMAEFVDPTLGLEENPIWLNLEDTLVIPAGKTMYCAAKADGMELKLTGDHVTVTHNDLEYTAQKGEVTLRCVGTGTFGHPVFAVTNNGTEEATYSVRFSYPEGHQMNPAVLKLGSHSLKPEKGGYCYTWTAESDGEFTFTVDSESGWKYMISNISSAKAGETRSADDAEPVPSETVSVKAGEKLRILVNTAEESSDEPIKFTASFTGAQKENAEET